MTPRSGFSRPGAAILAAIILAGLGSLAAPAGTQALAATPWQAEDSSQRLRQLEVFQELLTETVQRTVSEQVDLDIRQEQEAAADGAAGPPFVVRVGSSFGAHGIYIDGYGVIFSLQRPQVSVLPREFARHIEAPSPFGIVAPRVPESDSELQRASAGVFRFRTNMLQRQLRELETLLERSIARNATEEQIARTKAQIANLRQQLEEMEARFAPASPPAAAEAQAPPEPPPASAETVEPEEPGDPPSAELRAVELYDATWSRDRSLRTVLEHGQERMRAAVTGAVIDTLGNWGRVIKGLGEDERLSVLVLPAAALNFPRMRDGRQAPQEYVVSVRFGDVRDYDEGRIDFDEFRRRVRIHDRLGLPIDPGGGDPDGQ